MRREHGVDHVLIVGYEGEERYQGNNLEIREIAENEPWATSLAFLHNAPTANEVQEYRNNGFAGFSLYTTVSAISSWPDESFDAMNASGGIISINADPLALTGLRHRIPQLANTQILISHLGLPGKMPRNVQNRMVPLLALSEYENVYVKLSGLYAIDPTYPYVAARPVVETVLDAFGSDRLVWGSDFAPALTVIDRDHLFTVPDWCSTLLSPAEQSAVFGDNLIRLLDET